MRPSSAVILLKNAHLEAEISGFGAELVALRDSTNREFLWDGDPSFWTGRAPLLFPIVGKVPNDLVLVNGTTYRMRQHGLARISDFLLIDRSETSCLYRLEANEASLSSYPFDFQLDVHYALLDSTLTIQAKVENRSALSMPMSFGFHPALRWPLPGGGAKEQHEIVFSRQEDAPARRLEDGLLLAELYPTPIAGRRLHLSEALFAKDVMILDAMRSRALEYRSPNGTRVKIRFPDMPHLGLWSKSGAAFLCIEPWQGYAAPHGFCGELAEKPGGVELNPGTSRAFDMSIEILTQPTHG